MQEDLLSFYEENKDFLLKNYPGLKVLRLLQEFEETDLVLSEFQKELLTGKPLEYISNISHFYRESFYVDERVLIPRSETEILVEDSVQFIKDNSSRSCFEIGVGSGCISLSLGMEIKQKMSFHGSDISADALEVAQKNLLRHRDLLEQHEINFFLQDKIADTGKKYDFIVSNPPYIKFVEDRAGVHKQTDSFEPHTALYLNDKDFLSWYKDLFLRVSHSLGEKGAFFMEGHEDSLVDLGHMAKNHFDIEIKKDYTGRDRFLYMYKG